MESGESSRHGPPGEPPEPGHEGYDGVSGPGAAHHSRPRKFVIQSTFGVPRERRSRKSRPCDACRRRKTACVITTEPPCAFCKSRGIVCQSTSTADGAPLRPRQSSDHVPAQVPFSESGESADALAAGMSQPTGSPHQTSPSVSGASEFSPRIGVPPADQANYAFAPPPPAYMSTAMDIVQPTLNSPESTGSVSVHTLEDNPGRATYFMGRTGEQDPLVLDAFSYGILSEKSTVDASVVQVHRGDPDVDDLPLHFMFLSMGHPNHTNRSRQAASDSVEAKVWPHSDTLVRLYFKHVHPVYPVVSKVRFLRRYAANKRGLPACLRGAIYALASVLWAEDPTMRDRDPCPFQQHEIIEHAHNALRREIENPNFFILQACLLLIHVQPPSIDAMEAPTTFTFAAQATACAQMIGLHQESNNWDIETLEKRLRRKLWWAAYVTDCWAAVSHGNPPHISEASFNTQMLDIEDLQCDEDVPDDLRYLVEPTNTYFDPAAAGRFLETVKLTRTLRGVMDRNFQVNLSMSTMQDKLEAETNLKKTLLELQDWPSLLPLQLSVQLNRDPKVACFNNPLHLTYYASKVLIYRALMHPATKSARATPDSNLNRYLPYAIPDFVRFTEFFNSITVADLRRFWGRHARSQLMLCGNFLVYLFLMASKQEHVETALRMLETFRVKANTMSATDHVPTKAFMRATVIRTNSFFTQAASVMRHGPEASITEPITVVDNNVQPEGGNVRS